MLRYSMHMVLQHMEKWQKANQQVMSFIPDMKSI